MIKDMGIPAGRARLVVPSMLLGVVLAVVLGASPARAAAPAAPPLTVKPAVLAASSAASFAWTGASGATFACKLDSGDWAACTSPQALAGLVDGAHSFSVRQSTAAGISAATTYSWTVDATPPSAPLVSGAPGVWSRSKTLLLNFSGEAGASFRCQLDGGAAVACASPRTLSGLTDGAHSFSVTQTDRAGNVSPAATVSWTTDTVVPSAPTLSGTPANPTGATAAAISFSGESGASFECSVDSGDWAACTSPKRLTGLADGTHSLQVRQSDPAGNLSPVNTASWRVVTTTPAAPSITRGPGMLVTSTSQNFDWTGEPGGSYECQLDGGAWNSCTSPRAYTGLSQGAHNFKVRQSNGVNTGPALSIDWTVDSVAPAQPTFTSGPAAGGFINNSFIEFGFALEEGATASCQLDTGLWTSKREDCISPKRLNNLSEGTHTFRVKQKDLAGNWSPVTERSFTVDLTAPAAPAVTGIANNALLGAAFFGTGVRGVAFRLAGESTASFQCQLDGGGYASCGSSKIVGPLREGPHVFKAVQVDRAGSVSPETTVNFTVDTLAPSAPTLTATPPASSTSTAASFAWSGEAEGSYQCKLDASAWGACTSPRSYTVSKAAHAFQVRQTDAAGNVSAPTSYSWTVR